MTTATVFFEQLQKFLQERIELLQKAQAKTRDMSRWVAEIGQLNTASVLSKIEGNYKAFSEEKRNGKIAKHLERAVLFLEEIHFNDDFTSTLLPSLIHIKQKEESGARLKEARQLAAEYTQLAPDHISKVKRWLSSSLQWLHLLPTLRALALKWDTDPSQSHSKLGLIVNKGNALEQSKTPPIPVTQITRQTELQHTYSPGYEQVKACFNKIKTALDSGSVNKETLRAYVDEVFSLPTLKP